MADIDVKRAHTLGLEGARAAAEKMAEALGRKFDLKGQWSGNSLSFERPGVSGILDVTAKDVRLAVTLGFLLKAMKGSIERAVNEELDKALAAHRPAAAKKEDAAPRAKKAPAPRKKGG
jgi:putative polyhydroxyalkanoate system protein